MNIIKQNNDQIGKETTTLTLINDKLSCKLRYEIKENVIKLNGSSSCVRGIFYHAVTYQKNLARIIIRSKGNINNKI